MLGILAGFAAALGFGAADFLAGRSSRGIGVVWTVFTVQLAGLLALIPVMTLINVPLATAWDAWAVLVAVSAVNLAGILLLYRAFTIGSLSLVSPVASSFAAVAGLLAIIAGERPPALALNGAILLLIGVTLTAMVRGTGGVSRSGLPEAIGVALCFGIYYWALGELTIVLGALWPVVVTRAVQLLLILGVLVVRWPRHGHRPTSRALPLAAAAGLLDTVALVSFNLSAGGTFTTVAVALTSLYSTVTIVLAWLLLGERLSRRQGLGIALILAGVVLVSL